MVATNIAETSVTIPNISYVIDAGFVKVHAAIAIEPAWIPADSRPRAMSDERGGVCY